MKKNENIKTRACLDCKIEKKFIEFSIKKSGKYGIDSKCKLCKKLHYKHNKAETLKQQKTYRQENKDVIKLRKKRYYDQHKDEILRRAKQFYAKNGDILRSSKKDYYCRNKVEILKSRKRYRNKNIHKITKYQKDYHKKNLNLLKDYQKKYRKENKDKRNAYYRKYTTDRRTNDINFKMVGILRSRLYYAIKSQNATKCKSAVTLVGCSIEQLKLHLESQFTDRMSWNNYTFNGWHIDHIRPCSSFDLTDPKQQEECFHYTNLQPLWCDDNWIKNDTYNNLI